MSMPVEVCRETRRATIRGPTAHAASIKPGGTPVPLRRGSQIVPAAQEEEAEQRPRPEREKRRAAEEKHEVVGQRL